jgi:hypothetical protein
LLGISLGLLVAGCVSGKKIEIKEGTVAAKSVYLPKLNEVSTASLGDRMMHESFGWNVDCITPKVTKRFSGLNDELQAYQKLCGNSLDTNSFKSVSDEIYHVIEVNKQDGTSEFCAFGFPTFCINYSNNELIRSIELKSAMNSLQQSIEYMGRDGNSVKFVYSEFMDGMARSAFTREFIVDLTKGNTLKFKGAGVEILNATNTTIDYKVMDYFN